MAEARLRVTVVYSPGPRDVHEWKLEVPPGATVMDAIRACGMAAEFPLVDWGDAVVGIWGRGSRPDEALRDQDRVEIYRPLKVDPKVARRERFRRQGARAAGLFARKRQE
jgi:putative ubiquitin-RnfH superfamily antitoxin RatB of RatAB toxin-antitoxin module